MYSSPRFRVCFLIAWLCSLAPLTWRWLDTPVSGPLGWLPVVAPALGLLGLVLAGRGAAARGHQALQALQDEQAALKQSLQQSREAERRWRTMVDALPAQIAHLDAEERTLFANRRVGEVYGYPPEQMLGGRLREFIGEREYAILEPQVRAAQAGQAVSFEHAVPRPDGTRYAQVDYIPERDEQGQVQGLFLMVSDITQRKRAELAHAESEARLRTLTSNLPMLISYLDRDMVVRFANGTFEQWFGVPASKVVGRQVGVALGPALMEQCGASLERARQGERVTLEHTAQSRLGLLHLHATYVPQLGPDGSVTGIYTLSTDVTAMKESQRQLNQLAMMDTLTALPNRRSFHDRLQATMARVQASGSQAALMILDVDHFKSINDSLGHAAGDTVLKAFGACVQATVRPTDLVARLGGDEFVVILEDLHDGCDAAPVAGKIVEAVRHLQLDLDGTSLRITTSVGVAVLDGRAQTEAQLMARADAALYQAKKAGRDRFHIVIEAPAPIA
ncbi:sensor domain-containing diguanylate cyclase [Caldimonas brevitalea]|uniref:Diguanylate cyclase n=1 Tax=Caldimonas brevitalea TaxID=413882 RepID=A0A0G3BPU4_9BURK|nr:sensor domain-containing diguanylate cyclase [Caldimonas brevitalea]AKJ29366.1 diguanylate cyclase [Caldimonas brevitalea]